MTNLISSSASNEDPLWDPAWAASEARRLFGAQFDAAESLRVFGVALIKRLLNTSLTEVDDLVLIAGILRQAVSTFDGWLHDAQAGASDAAALHLRALFEADLTSQWIFTQGKERWAKQLYVSTIRRNRIWASRMITGTVEHAEFDAIWMKRTGQSYPIQAEIAADAAKEIADITALLNGPTYNSINKDFEAVKGKYEPTWSYPGAGGVKSIAAMAKVLGREADYSAIYSGLSQLAHGSDTDYHFTVRGGGQPVVEAVRNPARLGSSCALAGAFFHRIMRRFLDYYRPDELVVFNAKHASEWRPLLFPPDIQVDERFFGI